METEVFINQEATQSVESRLCFLWRGGAVLCCRKLAQDQLTEEAILKVLRAFLDKGFLEEQWASLIREIVLSCLSATLHC